MGRRRATRWVAAVLVTGLSASLGLLDLQPASAGETPSFRVMNTSESPPDGVWFRNSPHTADTNRETGYGVYMNEVVRDACYAWGDAVGPYNDTLWYYVTDLSRPTVNGHTNSGYLNAHYINDGLAANQIVPGVTQCGAQPTPVPPPPRAVAGYFSPFNLGAKGADGQVEDLRDQSGIHTAHVDNWYACSAGSATPYFALHGQLTPGQYYDRVGGWSLGRLGPAYLLQGMQMYGPNQLRQLNYINLIDPGNYSDLSSCDKTNGSGNTYAAWLKYNTGARLVILSGTLTQQNSSKGIQEVYFNPIRNQAGRTNIRSRVLVCNYNLSHYLMYDAGQYWIKHRIGATCPTLNYNGKRWSPTATWHP